MSLGSPATAQSFQPVVVYVPEGLTTSNISTTPADDETKYVTIDGVHARNPSATIMQKFSYRDFHLITFVRARPVTFYPIARPKLQSLDFTTDSLAFPGEAITVTVTFQVPRDTTQANFEFTPSWQSDRGGLVDFCCTYFNGKAF